MNDLKESAIVGLLRSPCTIPSHKNSTWRDWIHDVLFHLLTSPEAFDPERPGCSDDWQLYFVGAIGSVFPEVVTEWEDVATKNLPRSVDPGQYCNAINHVLRLALRGNEIAVIQEPRQPA